MKNFTFILFLFISTQLFAQRNFRIEVYEERIANNRDCDGFAAGDSDPTWRFDTPDNNWDCAFRNGNNGNFTIGDVFTIYDETWTCAAFMPGNIPIDFVGCENDNVTNCPSGTTGCDGGQATTTINVNPASFGTGTTNLNGGSEYCFNVAGGCYNGVTMCFRIRVIVTGNFIAAPSNNDICGASAISVGSFGTGNNVCANTQGGEPDPGSNVDPGNTTWHYFTATNNSSFRVSTNSGSTFSDPEIAVYSSSAGAACPTFAQLTEIGANDDITLLFNLQSEVNLNCLTPGQRYYVQFDGDDTNSDWGNYRLDVAATGVTIGTNDNICNADPLTLGSTYSGNNSCFGTQVGEPDPADGSISPSRTAWVYFDAPSSGHVNVTTDFGGTAFDTEIAVYRSSAGVACPTFAQLTEVGSDDDIVLLINTASELELECLTPGTRYYIQVDGDDMSDFGAYQIRVSTLGSPLGTHDNICNALSMALGTTQTANNSCFGTQAGEPDPADGSISPNRTGWHYFTAPASGHVIVTTDFGGTTFDTELAVYASSAGVACPSFAQLTEVGSDDDIVLLINTASELELECLTPGQRYYIQMDGDDASDYGDYQIRVSSVGPNLPTNDMICNATNMGSIGLGGSLNINNQYNYCATVVGEPTTSFTRNNTVWYRFTTGANPGTRITVSATNAGGDDIDLQLALFKSSNGLCGGVMSEVASDYDPVFLDEDLAFDCPEPNTTYWLMVDGNDYLFINAYYFGLFNINVTDNGAIRASNDLVCNAVNLGTLTLGGTLTDTRPAAERNNFCAGVQTGEPDPPAHTPTPADPLPGLNWDPDRTVWFRFTTAADIGCAGPYPGRVFTIAGTSDPASIGDEIDLQIALYEAPTGFNCNAPAGLVHVDNDYDPDIPLILTGEDFEVHCLKPNTTYYVQVDGSGVNIEGYFGLSVSSDNYVRNTNDNVCCAKSFGTVPDGSPTWPGPWTAMNNENNTCASKTVLENTNGTQDPASWDVERSVWYSFIPPPSGNVEIELESISGNPLNADYIDLQVAVYESSNNTCSGTFTLLDDYDDILGTDINNTEFVVKCLDPTKTYFIQVDGWEDPTGLLGFGDGKFNIRIRDYAQSAPNDTICDAIFIPGGGAAGSMLNGQTISLFNQNNFCADNILEPIPAEFGTKKTVWYTFKAPPSGRVMIKSFSDRQDASICDNIDLQIAVYDTGLPTDSCVCSSFRNGTMFEIDSDYNDYNPLTGPGEGVPAVSGDGGWGCGLLPPPQQYNEYMQLNCLIPGRCYYLMIDGADGLIEQYLKASDGFFDIEIEALPGPGPMTNDDVCNAIALGLVPNGGSVVTAPGAHNRCATLELNEPNQNLPNNALVALPPDFDMDRTVWFTFVAPSSGRVEILGESDPGGTFSDGLDMQIAVYESSNNTCDYSTFSRIHSEYEGLGAFYDEDLELTCLVPGRRYFIQVDAADIDNSTIIDDQEGFFSLTINDLPPLPNYGNDDICAAQNLGVLPSNTTTAFTNGANYCATVETGEPNTDPAPAYDPFKTGDETVWYTFTTGPNPGAITVELDNTSPPPLSPPFYYLLGFGPNMHIYEAPNPYNCTSFNGLVEVAANNNIIPLIDISTDITCPKPNTTYFIQIDGLDLVGDYGEFRIRLIDDGAVVVRPINDSLCDATNMGVLVSAGTLNQVNQNNFCAGEEAGEPNVSGTTVTTDIDYDETVWYYFTTGPNPGNVTVSTSNTNPALFWSNLTVYVDQTPASCDYNDLIEVEAAGPDILNGNSTLSLECLRPNTRYYIQFDASDALSLIDNFGTFDISVQDNGVPNTYPSNDYFCQTAAMDGTIDGFATFSAVPSGGSQVLVNQNNICATQETSEPNISNGVTVLNDPFYDETVWYAFITNGTPGTYTISINPTNFDPNIHIYTLSESVCNINALTEVGVDNNIDGGTLSYIMRCLEPNTKYFIQVDGNDAMDDEGNFTITVADDGVPSIQVPNDAICLATNLGTIALGGSNAALGNNTCASEENSEPNVSGISILTDTDYDETLWYKFTTGPTPGTFTISTSASTISPNLKLYLAPNNATCAFNQLTYLRNAFNILPNSNTSMTLTCLPPNTTYYIQVDGTDNVDDRGTFTLNIQDDGTPDVAPAYDDICSAVALGGVYPIGLNNQNNFCADIQTGEPGGFDTDDETVWFSFIPPTSGRVNINLTSVSGIDINFNIWKAGALCSNFSGLTQIGGNHDDLVSFSVSHTETCLQPGQLYYLQIDGGDIFGDNGIFNINITNADVAYAGPANNECAGAIALPVGTDPCQGSGAWNVQNYGFGGPSDPPSVSTTNGISNACGTNCGDTWYSFVMPATGNALIEGNDEYGPLSATSSNLNVVAYTGNCGSLTPVSCDQGGLGSDPGFYVQATPGTTVYLQVFNEGGAPLPAILGGSNTFGLCVTTRCGQDSCGLATPMTTFPTPAVYCWDVDGATGEDITAGVPGYRECGDGSEPDHSVYFTFFTGYCGVARISFNATVRGNCTIGIPDQGINLAIFQDGTPCDNTPENLVDCEQYDVCQGSVFNFNYVYSGLTPNTQYVIMIDAFEETAILNNPPDHNGLISVGTDCPLPVEILSFTGHNVARFNKLNWNVNNLDGVQTFEVERSQNAVVFEKIGEVSATQFVQMPSHKSYRFDDADYSRGVNYYRLRMKDLNGVVNYSNVVEIVNEPSETQILSLYPNPTRGHIALDLHTQTEGKYEIEILDMIGKSIMVNKLELTEGNHQLELNLEKLAFGMYVLNFNDIQTGKMTSVKFIKN